MQCHCQTELEAGIYVTECSKPAGEGRVTHTEATAQSPEKERVPWKEFPEFRSELWVCINVTKSLTPELDLLLCLN